MRDDNRRDDFNKLINYLENYYTKIQFPLDSLRTIHRNAYAFKAITNIVDKESDELKMMFTNSISMLHAVIILDVRVCYYLLRSSIELFIRHYIHKVLTRDDYVSENVDALFNLALSSSKYDPYIHDIFGKLKSVYSEACKYVHIAPEVYEVSESLKAYDYRNEYGFQIFIRDYTMAYHNVIKYLIINNRLSFETAGLNTRESLIKYLNGDEYLEILQYWNNRK